MKLRIVPLTLCAVLVGSAAFAKDVYPPLDVLLSTSKSVIGQPLAYPAGTPKITSAIITMVPGQETGWHRHEVPLYAHILEGELTVDYGPDGKKTYKTGDTFIEAFRTEHNGVNTGTTPARILAVFAGSDEAANTVMEKK